MLTELLKQAGWNETLATFYHYRTHAGREVDIVLEDRAGRVVGIEVKAASTIGKGDLSGLLDLAEAVGSRFHRGVILHLGTNTVSFRQNLHAMPVESLWRRV